ncbi:hypothetical protein [Paenibacillus sp. sgz500992]|uniref:hypothetical protein n=1 Tax=Paenibacillus sp. sgz500992 TaxID=3242476 RepID=UPI0036D21DAF
MVSGLVKQKTWVKADELYLPKRKVNNKGSRNFPHIIGSIPCRNMYIPEIMKRVAYFKDPSMLGIFLGELRVNLLQPPDQFSKVLTGSV